MSEIADPGREAVDKLLNDMEAKTWHPTDVARFARRLRAHLSALYARITELEGDLIAAADHDVTNDEFETLGGGMNGSADFEVDH